MDGRAEVLDPWVGQESEPATNQSEAASAVGALPARTVIEQVNKILGYDLLEVTKMAAGYREGSKEALLISESNLAVSFEVLPPEE